tara:strand:+ start:110 stop:340 length:231 start_codon:yes stop_codon:yes gene_type:complete
MEIKMKFALKSKTLWVNILTLCVGLATVFGNSELLKEYPEVLLGITSILIPTLNVFLRFITNEPITLSKSKEVKND